MVIDKTIAVAVVLAAVLLLFVVVSYAIFLEIRMLGSDRRIFVSTVQYLYRCIDGCCHHLSSRITFIATETVSGRTDVRKFDASWAFLWIFKKIFEGIGGRYGGSN